MGWFTYYKLLQKYNGDISKATYEEMDAAAKSNPNTPPAALSIAKRQYEQSLLVGIKGENNAKP